jgi:hypothetical protein
MAQYHYSTGSDQEGPWDATTIATKVWQNPSVRHLVWTEGMAEWANPESVVEINAILESWTHQVALDRQTICEKQPERQQPVQQVVQQPVPSMQSSKPKRKSILLMLGVAGGVTLTNPIGLPMNFKVKRMSLQ